MKLQQHISAVQDAYSIGLMFRETEDGHLWYKRHARNVYVAEGEEEGVKNNEVEDDEFERRHNPVWRKQAAILGPELPMYLTLPCIAFGSSAELLCIDRTKNNGTLVRQCFDAIAWEPHPASWPEGARLLSVFTRVPDFANLFGLDPEGRVVHKDWKFEWHEAQTFHEETGFVDAVATFYNKATSVFAIRPHQGVFVKSQIFPSTQWNQGWENLGIPPTEAPLVEVHAVYGAHGDGHVFVVAQTGEIWRKSWKNCSEWTTTEWIGHQGMIVERMSVTMGLRSGYVHIFGLSKGCLYHQYCDKDGEWKGPERMSNAATDNYIEVSAIESNFRHDVHVFLKRSNGTIEHTTLDEEPIDVVVDSVTSAALAENIEDMIKRLNQQGIGNPSSWTALHRAASDAFVELIPKLLARADIHVNAQDAKGFTALHCAVERGHLNVVDALLLKEGIDVNAKDSEGRTPLITAVDAGLPSVMRPLLARKDVDVNTNDNTGRTALHHATDRGSMSAVKELLKREDVDVSAKDTHGKTPLALLEDSGALDEVNELLPWVAGQGLIRIVRVLLERESVDVNYKKNGMTALHASVCHNHFDVVEELLQQKGIDVNAGEGGWTPLMTAAGSGNSEIVRILLARDDTDVNAKDEHGRSALLTATERGSLASVEELLRRKDIAVDTQNSRGESVLNAAAAGGHDDIFKTLLAHVHMDEQTILDQAIASGHLDTVHALTRVATTASPPDLILRMAAFSSTVKQERYYGKVTVSFAKRVDVWPKDNRDINVLLQTFVQKLGFGEDGDDKSGDFLLTSEGDAEKSLTSLLHKDGAYGEEIMELYQAAELAEEFLGFFTTNAQYYSAVMLSYATFQDGIIGLDDATVGILYFEDED